MRRLQAHAPRWAVLCCAKWLDFMNLEFEVLVEQARTHWWRVPLALVVTISIPLLLHYAINRPEEREVPPPQINPPVARPRSLSVLRYSCPLIVARFAWIYFAGVSIGHNYELSKIEAVLWCLYAFVGIPLWFAWESEHREAMYNLRSSERATPARHQLQAKRRILRATQDRKV